MTTLVNSFEGGSNGVTVSTANSGGLSGNPFDVMNIGTGATVAYSTTHAAHGSVSCEVATTASSAAANAEWSASMGSQTQVWFRMYLYFTAWPAANIAVWRAFQGGNQVCGLDVFTPGLLKFFDANNSGIITSTATIPVGSWFRVEGFVIGSASTGQVQMKLFDNPDGTIPTETDTSAANQNTFGHPDNYRYGGVSASTNIGPFWMDNVGLSNTGYLGPAKAASSGSIVPSLIAAGAI